MTAETIPPARGRVVVTGAAGRIGRYLCPALADLGWDVVALDRAQGAGWIAADCHDTDRMADLCAGADGIVHLAGMPQFNGNWRDIASANIDATLSMIEAGRRARVPRFLYASSIHTVGAQPIDADFTPDLADAPSGLYGATKLSCEALLKTYAAKTAMATLSLRICTFAPAPRNARELRTWFAPEDCRQLVDKALRADLRGHATIWGISANSRTRVIDPTARAIGYAPIHDAEVHIDTLRSQGIDPDDRAGWDYLGGRMMVENELDGGLIL